jgi:hypothetical protein
VLEPPYRSPEVCATCRAPLVAAEAYLSGSGPVCEACHKATFKAERRREAVRESNTSALLGGIFSTLAGLALLVMGVLAAEIPVKIFAISVVVVGGAVLHVPRMETDALRGTVGKKLVYVGAVLGALGVLALAVRLAG